MTEPTLMPDVSPAGYLLLGLTAIVGVLAGVLVFAVLRFFAAAARDARRTCASRRRDGAAVGGAGGGGRPS